MDAGDRVKCVPLHPGELRVEVTGTDDDESFAERAVTAALASLRARKVAAEAPIGAHPVILGASPPMLQLFRMLERVRQSDATILVLGENGTGKELVAKAVHQGSKRSSKSFVATNCSAFNDNLLESELFGHRRGAFTGAISEKAGLFEVADGGTFFMDEVGDMSPSLQVKLLRVLQEGTFMPVGGTETRKVDVRIVAATNRDLAAMVKQGTFREDLYYRLHVVVLRVPPLRERVDPTTGASDVELLANAFLQRLAKREKTTKNLTPRCLERLLTHDWPGNVRELENEMERLWVLAGRDDVLDVESLSPSIGRRRPTRSQELPAHRPTGELRVAQVASPSPTGDTTTSDPPLAMPEAVERLERSMIARELLKAGGNKTKAADALGISRRNLIRKVQTYGLDDVGRTPGGE